jgi:hypothetical protein
MTNKMALDKAFTQGYVAAVSNILNTHAEDVVASDVLNAIGGANLKRSQCSPDDWRVLLKFGLVGAKAKRRIMERQGVRSTRRDSAEARRDIRGCAAVSPR